MENNIEASPFIDTNLSLKAKTELYNQPFKLNKIGNILGSKPIKKNGFLETDEEFAKILKQWEEEEKNVLFEGWTCKDMFHYQEFKHIEKNIIITFEFNEYVVKNKHKEYVFPLHPDTIDDFINDLKRIGVTLYWKKEIADIYGIENITSDKKILDYYKIIEDINGSSTKKW